ncbi:MAG: hypothetical protein UT29_C0001G0117 [Candidatus Yanofskybacteria bacterium GW2011_GWA1_39_13]|uniref:Uncharacterized protein n=1 Tax=Yanofskybacteria sp. (strain GW2011_GWA1_39_13) TaxID=1619019 RepID=A0A0G0QLU5_YANXG|nr:MAG: hypothetical protein UT29_C0001G0117 [Candidatus Yanofskybacteria bacterium GW2011_GWA1_39_13]
MVLFPTLFESSDFKEQEDFLTSPEGCKGGFILFGIYDKLRQKYVCPGGGIGIHARLKIVFRKD